MEQNHLDRALKKIMEFSSYFNQYFQHKEPWKKGPGTANCVYLSVNAASSLAIAILPFMPNSANKIWNQLGLGDTISANCGMICLNLEFLQIIHLEKHLHYSLKLKVKILKIIQKQLGPSE